MILLWNTYHDAAGVDSHGVGRADAGAYHKNWQQRSSKEDRCLHTIEWAATWEGTRNFLTKKLAATCFLGSSWLPPTRKKIGSNVLPWNFVASLLLKKIGSNVLPWNFVASLLLNNFLNNSLEFPEKANSTIVSERWRQKHVTCNYLSWTKFTHTHKYIG